MNCSRKGNILWSLWLGCFLFLHTLHFKALITSCLLTITYINGVGMQITNALIVIIAYPHCTNQAGHSPSSKQIEETIFAFRVLLFCVCACMFEREKQFLLFCRYHVWPFREYFSPVFSEVKTSTFNWAWNKLAASATARVTVQQSWTSNDHMMSCCILH